jgi:hypothetical protein
MRLMLREDIKVTHLLIARKGVSRAQLQRLGITVSIAIDVKEGAKTFRILHSNLFRGSYEARDDSQARSPDKGLIRNPFPLVAPKLNFRQRARFRFSRLPSLLCAS